MKRDANRPGPRRRTLALALCAGLGLMMTAANGSTGGDPEAAPGLTRLLSLARLAAPLADVDASAAGASHPGALTSAALRERLLRYQQDEPAAPSPSPFIATLPACASAG